MTNVISLKKFEQETRVIHTVNDFVNEAGINSDATKEAYLTDATQLIKFFGLESSSVDALVEQLTRKNLVAYRNYLLNEANLGASTVKRKFSSIKHLMKFLYSIGYQVDFNIIDGLQTIKATKNSYEVLSGEEAQQAIEWIEKNEKHLAKEKALYCSLAYDTGVRAAALNSLTKDSFVVLENEVIIRGIDKGKKAFKKSISKGFYEEIKSIIDFDSLESKTLFNFSEQNRSTMMKRMKKGLGWENRNITFHSFKKGAVTHAFNVTGNIQVAQKVGGHESISTTQVYLADNEQAFQGAISDKHSIATQDVRYSDYSKDELVEALSKLPEAVQLMIKKNLQK